MAAWMEVLIASDEVDSCVVHNSLAEWVNERSWWVGPSPAT